MVIMETHSDKKTKGRQKIEIKRIQAKSNLQVTFSKRRAGLVKKASELSLLCGAEVAVLAFSPGGKVFAFGHPNMDAVLNRYLNSEEVDNSVDVISSSSTSLQVQHWNKEYEEALKELEEEKRRLALTQQWNKICENDVNAGFWWDHELIESMGLEELDEHVAALQQLKINVANRVKSQLLLANNNNNNNNNTDFDNQNMGIGDADFGGLGFGNGLF